MRTVVVRVPGSGGRRIDPTSLVVTVWARKMRRIVLPWLPEEIESSGMGRVWVETPRPGRTPLFLDTGQQLERHTFTVRLCAPDLDRPVHKILNALGSANRSGKFVVVNVGAQPLGTGGLFRISDMRARIAEVGPKGHPVDATVDLEFTRATLVADPVGPLGRTKKRKKK